MLRELLTDVSNVELDTSLELGERKDELVAGLAAGGTPSAEVPSVESGGRVNEHANGQHEERKCDQAGECGRELHGGRK